MTATVSTTAIDAPRHAVAAALALHHPSAEGVVAAEVGVLAILEGGDSDGRRVEIVGLGVEAETGRLKRAERVKL